MSKNPAASAWHASLTPEQRAAWRARVRAGTSAGMHEWHAKRTPAEREATQQRMRDAAMDNVFVPRHPVQTFKKGQTAPMQTAASNQQRSLTRVKHASVKRIMREIVTDNPEEIRAAILEGIQAPPPRSFPYIALAAAYLDGKPTADGDDSSKSLDLSGLSLEELKERVAQVAAFLDSQTPRSDLPVIDVTPQPEDQ